MGHRGHVLAVDLGHILLCKRCPGLRAGGRVCLARAALVDAGLHWKKPHSYVALAWREPLRSRGFSLLCCADACSLRCSRVGANWDGGKAGPANVARLWWRSSATPFLCSYDSKRKSLFSALLGDSPL